MLQRTGTRYRTVRQVTSVFDRTPAELVLLVYDSIDDHLRLAQHALADGTPHGFDQHVQRALDLLVEGLLATLDHRVGGEVSRNLARIYDFAMRRLLHARLHRDAAAVAQAAAPLRELRQGWAVLATRPVTS